MSRRPRPARPSARVCSRHRSMRRAGSDTLWAAGAATGLPRRSKRRRRGDVH